MLVANLYKGYGPTTGGGSPPNQPSLLIVPNGDGTATATVSGSTSGATNTIDVVALGSSGSVSWTNAGSRTSDGTVTLTLGNGSYLATCESSLAGLPSLPSGPYLFEMTGGAAQTTFNSPHAALAHSVQANLISLIGTRITGIVSDSIRVRMVPYGNDFLGSNPAHELPGIIVTYVQERGLDGTNVRDDIGYPIRIVFFTRTTDAQNRLDLETQDDISLTWRQTVSDVFRMQGLNVTNYAPQNPLTFYLADIDYEPQFNWPVQANQQLAVGSVKLSFRLRKVRG